MRATSIRVDRPAERHLRLVRDSVQRRLRSHLVEARVQCFRRVERPHHGAVRVARQPPLLLDLDFQLVPTHEHMFAHGKDGCVGSGRAAIRHTGGVSVDESLSEEEYARWGNEAGFAELRQLLFWRWDPIGVGDAFPVTADEYDLYARVLLSRLRAGA